MREWRRANGRAIKRTIKITIKGGESLHLPHDSRQVVRNQWTRAVFRFGGVNPLISKAKVRRLKAKDCGFPKDFEGRLKKVSRQLAVNCARKASGAGRRYCKLGTRWNSSLP